MERLTKKVDGVWTALCKYGRSPYPVVTQDIIDRLAAYEDTGLAPEEIQIQKEAMESMGWFGKMFQRYKGDPRGRIGTLGTALGKSLALLIAESAKNRQPVKDVDGNTWLPMLLDEFESMAEECEYNGQPDCALPDGAQCPHGVPTVPPVTNADKIRAMSDEELADIFLRANFCKCCEHNKDGVCNYICAYPNIPLYDGCIQAALTWMKQPVEEEA